MAAQLKAEASELEAVVQKERLAAVSEAFSDFDTNNDGSISVEELRIGLVKVLKDESVSEDLAKKLMAAFDESGDGAIQLNEFKGVEAFKQKIEGFLREERDAALQAEVQAKEAKAAAELEELPQRTIHSLPGGMTQTKVWSCLDLACCTRGEQ